MSNADRIGRIALCSFFGASALNGAVQGLQEHNWWAFGILAAGALLTYGLVRQLRSWAHRSPAGPENRWTRTDGGITAMVVFCAVGGPISAWLTDDPPAERLSYWVVTPIWIAIAVYFVVLARLVRADPGPT